MNTVDLIHYSLGFSFELLEGLVTDLTPEQADWQPPGDALPISALYWHIVHYVDKLVHDWGMGQQPPLAQTAGWGEKVLLASPAVDPDDPMGDLRAVNQGLRVDLEILHDYARATAETILNWVASLTPEDLERTLPTPIGDLNLGQILQAFIVLHINNHIGEISTVRGCQGLKGYPW
jgi:hypothetical protein